MNLAIWHADIHPVRGSRPVAWFLVVALVAVGCGRGAENRPAMSRTVPMATWVAGLCSALGRFADDLGLTDLRIGSSSQVLPDARFGEFLEALRRLRSDVEALGIPDVDGGAAVASDVVAGVRRSLATLERSGGPAGLITSLIGAPPGSGEYSAIAYPFGLLLFLGAAGESVEVAVYLEDPVRDATIARLSRLLERRLDVASVEFESKAHACKDFKELFADQKRLIDALDCDVLPASFRLKLTSAASGTSLQDALIHERGIENVVIQPTQGDLVAKMTIFTQGDLLELDPVRAEASRHAECTSLPPLAVLAPS